MVKRRIRQHYQATDIQYVNGTPGPLQVGVILDVDSRGLTDRQYVQRSLEETLRQPVASFELVVVEKEEEAE
jgi:hypothetical protein